MNCNIESPVYSDRPTPNMPSKSAPIVIIGAGVFGLSTALQLANDGYTDITVLEKDDQMPSRGSAGYDLNKIVRPEYEDPWYTELTIVRLTISPAFLTLLVPILRPY